MAYTFAQLTASPTMSLELAVFAILVLLLMPRLLTRWIVDRVSDTPRCSGWFLTSTLIVTLACMIGAGELVLLPYVAIWGIIFSVRLWPTWRAAIPGLVSIAVIGFHIYGYRIYGGPAFVDNRSEYPMAFEIERLETPNFVVATDGSRHAVLGTSFVAEITSLPPDEQRLMISPFRERIGFRPDSASPSGFIACTRIHYWCGNTYFPRFLPSRLPRYRTDDLASVLRRVSFSPELSAR